MAKSESKVIDAVFELTGEMIAELRDEMAGSNNRDHWKHYGGGIETLKNFETRIRAALADNELPAGFSLIIRGAENEI